MIRLASYQVRSKLLKVNYDHYFADTAYAFLRQTKLMLRYIHNQLRFIVLLIVVDLLALYEDQ